MIYWPWSMFWTLLNDPVKRLFNHIYNQLRAVYQYIVDRAFKSVEGDFAPFLSEEPDKNLENYEDQK